MILFMHALISGSMFALTAVIKNLATKDKLVDNADGIIDYNLLRIIVIFTLNGLWHCWLGDRQGGIWDIKNLLPASRNGSSLSDPADAVVIYGKCRRVIQKPRVGKVGQEKHAACEVLARLQKSIRFVWSKLQIVWRKPAVLVDSRTIRCVWRASLWGVCVCVCVTACSSATYGVCPLRCHSVSI